MTAAIRITAFEKLVDLLQGLARTSGKPVRIFPIGTQGVGKSTLGERLTTALGGAGNEEFQIISPDQLRLSLYQASHPNEPPDYRRLKPFISSRREGAIRALATRMFLESKAPFAYLDRMNLTAETRAPFLSSANFNVAVILKPAIGTVLRRHRSRPDKAEAIPDWVVISGYRQLEWPENDEFDVVVAYEPEGDGDASGCRARS